MTTSEMPIELANLRIAAVINSSSGGCDADCSGTMAAILHEQGIAAISLECVEGKDVESALQKALGSRSDVLIVLGGDGSIRTAGELCSGTDTKLIPLPGGTMNMLPKALYGEGTWDAVLRGVLAAPKTVTVGGGEVEGHKFFCAGIFGSPALWADAREAVRKNRWLDAFHAAIRAYQRNRSQKIGYRYDNGDWGNTVALAAICPLISAKSASTDKAFDMALLEHQKVSDAATLAWNAVFAEWRKDENVTSIRADKVEIRGGAGVPAILDGERVTLSRKPEVRYSPNCFKAIVSSKA